MPRRDCHSAGHGCCLRHRQALAVGSSRAKPLRSACSPLCSGPGHSSRFSIIPVTPSSRMFSEFDEDVKRGTIVDPGGELPAISRCHQAAWVIEKILDHAISTTQAVLRMREPLGRPLRPASRGQDSSRRLPRRCSIRHEAVLAVEPDRWLVEGKRDLCGKEFRVIEAPGIRPGGCVLQR